MTAERPRRGELTQLVPHHLLGRKHTKVRAAVVNQERVADELRHDCARPGPRLNRVTSTALSLPYHLKIKLLINKRTFFLRSSH